jgi:hypothetical protein
LGGIGRRHANSSGFQPDLCQPRSVGYFTRGFSRHTLSEPYRPARRLRYAADRRAKSSAKVNQLLTASRYSGVGHSGRVCWPTASFKRACVPMALDPEEIVTLLLLAALAIAWNWRLRH